MNSKVSKVKNIFLYLNKFKGINPFLLFCGMIISIVVMLLLFFPKNSMVSSEKIVGTVSSNEVVSVNSIENTGECFKVTGSNSYFIIPFSEKYNEVELNNGIPTYTIIENVAWDHIPLTQKSIDLVKKADAVCYGTLSLRHADSKNTVTTLLSYARKDALRFYDINLRQHYYSKELIEELLKLANVFKVNDEELAVLRDLFNLKGTDEEVCKYFMNTYNLKYVILTAGEKYSQVWSETETSYYDTPKVTVADTVGAGDAFSGAFVQGILAGKNLKEAHKQAVEISAFVCTKTGAWPEYANCTCAK